MPVRVEDASGFAGHADEVFAPRDEDEVIAILRRAGQTRTPVTIAGAGTGVTGGRVPDGGWLLSLEKLRRLEVHPGRAIAGAGVPLAELHSAAAQTGQFYPPDPTEQSAAVGGAVATNASGSRSLRYGDTRRHVLRLRVALMDGRLLEVRRGDTVDFDVPALPLPATTKHTAGYRLRPGMDWIDLFTGSEGTLGVVTEAELILLPAPGALLTGVVFFPSDELAIEAVEAWRQQAHPRRLEYLDRPSLDLLRAKFAEIPASAGAALLIEQDLASEQDPEADRWHDRLAAAQALLDGSWFAAGAGDRERFRRFRHALPEMVNDAVRRNGFTKLGSDYAVPPARNREMMAIYREGCRRHFPGSYVIFGHIGDAHLHVNLLPRSEGEFARGRELMLEFARAAVALGGTVSAEHGLGKRKRGLLELQYTAAQIESMKRVKRRLDPDWLLGQGTLFPHETGR
ncbi:MAG: FAD-binding oxidoreductase [Candidatus Solibacter usitatus]|nr:FAD-binding oxidoreductase [Candidatus Solibacter usitatus]